MAISVTGLTEYTYHCGYIKGLGFKAVRGIDR